MSQSLSNCPHWIWSDPSSANPKNRFTWFRKVVNLKEIPDNSSLLFAANSNAQLWINGTNLRRKVARYHEAHITAEVVETGPHLKCGKNVIVVLHHNWGDIVTFQRTGNRQAALYLCGEWVQSDDSWKCCTAPEFLSHEDQIIGIAGNAPRIRYPQVLEAGKKIVGIHQPDFDDSGWNTPTILKEVAWNTPPPAVETPGQRESWLSPANVLAAGRITNKQNLEVRPLEIAGLISSHSLTPDPKIKHQFMSFINGSLLELSGKKGESFYVTFDFQQPVHGFPSIEIDQSSEGIILDLGYAEIARSQYDGRWHVREDGWIFTEGVVGKGYADRIITGSGQQSIELPDERTARWWTIQIHFRETGSLRLSKVGFIKSQYPIKPVGSFRCGNPHIDQIVNLCLIHAEVTMSDAYVDTPGREDGQWIEDDRPRALLAARWFDDTHLRKFLIRTHAEGQGPDGDLHPFSPSNFPAYPATCDWSVQWVACLWDDYFWSGSTELIERYWENLVRYWDKMLSFLNADGLWMTAHLCADLRVGVHPHGPHQSSGMITPWMIQRLEWSIRMAEAVGQKKSAENWRAKVELMKKAFRKFHVVPENNGIPTHVADRCDPDNPEVERGYSQAGQTIAILADLLTPDEALQDVTYAFQEPDGSPPDGVTRWNNPTYFNRSLKILSKVGLHKLAVRHLIERYSQYLPAHPANPIPIALQGPWGGPLPEYWVSREDLDLKEGEINPAQPEDDTGSHGWGAVPLLWMHENLLGVEITEPGGTTLSIAPHDGGLPYVCGQTMTPKGLVSVYWDPQQFLLEVEIPIECQTRLSFPEESGVHKVVWTKGESGSIEQLSPLTFLLRKGGRYQFSGK